MTSPDEGGVLDLNSSRPFRNKALEYLDNGWQPIPLPEKQKFPPPLNTTGRNAIVVDQRRVAEWFKDDSLTKANLGLHLSTAVPPQFDPDSERYAVLYEKRSRRSFWLNSDDEPRWSVVGIDVDDYSDDSKKKAGGKTLRELEKEYGKLPTTWTSSSRNDGVSGIRFFLVPAEYSYRGQVGESIECIQEVHRYAVAWPSAHPTAGQYTWFPPGQTPKGAPNAAYCAVVTRAEHLNGAEETPAVGDCSFGSEEGGSEEGGSEEGGLFHISIATRQIPSVWDLPRLPKKWIEYLSQGFTGASEVPIDMDSSVDEIYLWAKKNFTQKGGNRNYGEEAASEQLESLGCSAMRKRVASWVEEAVRPESDSHSVIRDGHWNLFYMGLEGHSGWMAGVRVLESVWLRHVFGDPEAGGGGSGKRGEDEASKEVFRSRTNALRKIKAKVDREASDGRNLLGRTCACYAGDAETFDAEGVDPNSEEGRLLDAISSVPDGALKDPGEYEMNDDGNGEHFCDLYQDRFKYVLGYDRWIFWHEGSNPGWQWAETGMTRRAYRKVKIRQQNYARQLLNEAMRLKQADDPGAKAAMDKARIWRAWSERSGNNGQVRGALEAASENLGVSIDSAEFDSREHLLGVANGVLELRDDGVYHRKARKEDMVVTNTNVPYIPLKDILSGKGGTYCGVVVTSEQARAYAEGARLFQEFLDLFLPPGKDGSLEEREWVQQMIGMCLIGGNPSKRFIFLHGESHTGKSTILNLLMAALGEYAGSAEMSIFEQSKLNPALAQALPWRLLTTTEANALGGKGLEGDMLKRLTGNDYMSAELKGVNEIIRRKPSFTPVVATNSAPQIENLDEALRERVEVLPFKVRQDPNDAPVGVEEKMRELSLPAVLSWMVEGWIMYSENRLRNRPKSSIEVKARFGREMSGDLGQFMEDCLILTGNIDDAERVDDVYQAYTSWARQQNIQDSRVWDKPVFGRRMGKAGYRSHVKRIDGVNERQYRGVKLRNDLKKVLKFKMVRE